MQRFRAHVVAPMLTYLRGLGVDGRALGRAWGLPADAETRPFVELPLPALHAPEASSRMRRPARPHRLREPAGARAGMIGHRIWWPKARLGIVSRLGLGYGKYTVEAQDGRNDMLARDAERFSRDNLGGLPLAVELELSVAFGF